MVQIIMDHGVSWCFGTNLATNTRTYLKIVDTVNIRTYKYLHAAPAR